VRGRALLLPPSNDDPGAERIFVYIIGSSGKGAYRTYVGWTTDLDRRIAQHNAGTGAKSTRGRSWVLLYAERCASRPEAMSREWHLKQDRALRRILTENARASTES
jgi:putative endonuclease